MVMNSLSQRIIVYNRGSDPYYLLLILWALPGFDLSTLVDGCAGNRTTRINRNVNHNHFFLGGGSYRDISVTNGFSGALRPSSR